MRWRQTVERAIGRGSLTFVSPYRVHRVVHSPGSRFFVINFHLRFLRPELDIDPLDIGDLAPSRTPELAQEYMQVLCEFKRFDEAETIYASLPREMQTRDRIQILHGRIALERGDESAVVDMLKNEYVVVREGETGLTDIWFELMYWRMAKNANKDLNENEKAEIRRQYPPPAHIDFRVVVE